MRHAAAAVANLAQADNRAVVLRRADDDMRVIRKALEHILVAAAVLQRHQIRVGADERAVVFQRAFAEHRLHKHDHQIDGLHALRVARDRRMIDRAAAVRLRDFQAVRLHLFNQGGVHIHDGHIVFRLRYPP